MEIICTHLEEGEGQLLPCWSYEPPAEEHHQAVLHLRGRPIRVDGDAGGHGRTGRLPGVQNRLSIKNRNRTI